MGDRGLIELKLGDGTSVFVESTEDVAAGQGPQRISRGQAGAQEATDRFEDAVARIRPAAQALLDGLRDLNTPEQVSLEFGIKFNAKAGVVFASVDSEAVFKVSLTWKNPAPIKSPA
jgi:hypothetical protein